MNNMQKDIFKNNKTSENKTEKKLFTKAERDGKIEFIEREVDRFDFEGFEVVRREFFSKANCPAITIKYGSIVFNVRAIRKLDECHYIHILINTAKKKIIIKPCEEDEKDSLQWCRVDKHSKIVSRSITGKLFTAQLYKDMNWNIESTIKMLGTLEICKGEKIFVFDLNNAEAYLHLAETSDDETKRRKRIPFMPEHWHGNYGQSYEESKTQMVMTFEGVPEGFVKITIPQIQHRKSPEMVSPTDLFPESSIPANTNQSNESVTEARKSET
jgi:hypothetical protein